MKKHKIRPIVSQSFNAHTAVKNGMKPIAILITKAPIICNSVIIYITPPIHEGYDYKSLLVLEVLPLLHHLDNL